MSKPPYSNMLYPANIQEISIDWPDHIDLELYLAKRTLKQDTYLDQHPIKLQSILIVSHQKILNYTGLKKRKI